MARVFAAPEKVAPSTQAKVRDAADLLGYVPNAIARSLKSQRTRIVGAVVPADGEYWQHVVTRFSRRLAERGRQLLLFSFTDADQVDDVIAAVAQYQLDGVIAASASIAGGTLNRITATSMPVVAFNQPDASKLLPSVTVDNEAGTGVLARHLVDCGALSVTYVGGVATTSTDRLRFRGASRSLSEHGVTCAYVEAGAFSYEAGYKVANQLVDTDLPDALMVGSDEVAFGVIDGLRERGIEAPDDVLLTGFDGLPQSAWVGYDLTTLEQPIDLLVDHAVDQLLDPTSQGDPIDVVVPGTLRQGRTTRHA